MTSTPFTNVFTRWNGQVDSLSSDPTSCRLVYSSCTDAYASGGEWDFFVVSYFRLASCAILYVVGSTFVTPSEAQKTRNSASYNIDMASEVTVTSKSCKHIFPPVQTGDHPEGFEDRYTCITPQVFPSRVDSGHDLECQWQLSFPVMVGVDSESESFDVPISLQM